MALVKITCKNGGAIPFIGSGPITNPIAVEESVFLSLKAQGYSVHVVEDSAIRTEVVAAVIEKDKKADKIKEQVAEVKEAVEDLEDDAEELEDENEVDVENMTNKELKAALTELDVEFTANANKATLIELLKAALAK
jgi:hypothetical protein